MLLFERCRVKQINPEYTVEKIVQRMKEAAALSSPPVPLAALPIPLLSEQSPADGNASSPLNLHLDIHPISLQPPFHPNSDDRYHVNDLLKYNDQQFVRNAYQAILKRPADESGCSGLIEGLRSGLLNKIDVIARLRYSPEGREKNVQVEGLRFPAWLRRAYRLPLLGYLLNLSVALTRLPLMVRSQRQFEAHVLAQQETLVSQINHLGHSLLSHAQQVAQLLDARTHSIAQLRQQFEQLLPRHEQLMQDQEQLRHSQEQLRQQHEHLGLQQEQLGQEQEQLGQQYEEFAREQAATHETVLHRVGQLTRYLEDRLNEETADRQAELWNLGTQLGQATSEWQQQLELTRTYYDQVLSAERDRVDLLTHLPEQIASLELGRREMQHGWEDVRAKHQQLTAELIMQEQRVTRLLSLASNRLATPFDEQQLEVLSREQAHLLDAFYASFDEQFRGRREEIKERLKVYLPFVKGKENGPIIDVGCGRGEWLELLREEGITASGVDANSVLVRQCHDAGLTVEEADLIEYLGRIPDGSVAGVTGFHIAEHLPIETLVGMLNEAMRVLKSGGVIILETPNPRNVLVGTCNFYFDPTHRNPLPSEVLEFLVQSRGFAGTEVLPLNPSDQIPVPGDSELVARFNQYFYGPMDYGIVGWKPS
jgi:O-antigen chain-terminating methyltransferase